ncbi:hypothetical protein HPB51_017003 [Rhipicephalus microplus]|uniref:Uncharacterized protein n=1 Tax=Rhipicephalus microplus TaxID=6941 RepID=A0A9J6F411_RHIMP|nr:hypothetical protein HPB51_017003 [Rhipicephalus microplus]
MSVLARLDLEARARWGAFAPAPPVERHPFLERQRHTARSFFLPLYVGYPARKQRCRSRNNRAGLLRRGDNTPPKSGLKADQLLTHMIPRKPGAFLSLRTKDLGGDSFLRSDTRPPAPLSSPKAEEDKGTWHTRGPEAHSHFLPETLNPSRPFQEGPCLCPPALGTDHSVRAAAGRLCVRQPWTIVPGGPIPPRSSDESFVPRNRRRIPQGPAVAPAHRPATQWSASTVAAFAELSGGDIALASKTSLAAGRNRLLRRRKTRLEGGQLSGHLKRRDDMCKHSASLGLSTRITNNPVPGIHNTSTHTLVGVPERHAHRTPKLP